MKLIELADRSRRQFVQRAGSRLHPSGDARLNDKAQIVHELTHDHERSTAVSRLNTLVKDWVAVPGNTQWACID
jgi:hypothetical protein